MNNQGAMFLAIGLAAMWAAPLALSLAPKGAVGRTLASFLPPVMGTLIVLDVLPYAYKVIGPWAPALAIWGLVVPLVIERLLATDRDDALEGHHPGCKHDDSTRLAPLLLVTIGLAAHAAVDGASFATAAVGSVTLPLLAAVHRLIEGVFLWGAVERLRGRRAAVWTLALNTLLTLGGYAGGSLILDTVPGQAAAAAIQALVAGSLLHLITHQHLPKPDGRQ